MGPQLDRDAVIYPSARIIRPDRLRLGDHSSMDDFVFFNASGGAMIRRYVHIACQVSVMVAVVSTSVTTPSWRRGAVSSPPRTAFDGGARMSTHWPDEHRCVRQGGITIGCDAFLGANTVVMPAVRIGEGAVAGASAVVTTDLDPWTVYTGAPARPQRSLARPHKPGP